jgi:hypothetical protein
MNSVPIVKIPPEAFITKQPGPARQKRPRAQWNDHF